MEQHRSRYLARKFFSLWAKKTFGQVLPSTDRHLLPELIFKVWRAYVCQQQEKWNKYSIAESHAEKQALLGTWQRWALYAAVQRRKRGRQRAALAFRNRSCLRIPWAVWRRRHQQSCAGRKMDVLALQHWAQSLQIRAWLQWRELFLHSQKDKQREMRAVTHHQHWQLKRCMEAWLEYLNLQKAKQLQNELAQEHHCSSVARQCFSGWQLSWECRRRLQAQQEGVEQRAARPASWRAFVRWKLCVVLCVEEARQCELAENHYRRHLLKLGLKGLCQNVVSTHLQQMRRNLSWHQHQVTLLEKCWSCWKSHLEEEEEAEQQALTSVACANYRRVLMRQVFDTWFLKACEQREYRLGEKRAALHFERRLLHCSWCVWHGRTAAQQEQEGLLFARGHYSNLLLLKAFCLWKQNTQERTTERLKEMKALRFHNSKCLQQTWNKWREYVGCQHEKWRKLVEADMHYQHTLLGRTLAAWKSYQGKIQCILQQAAEQEQQHRRLLLRQLLHTWRENALALIHEAKADEHYRRAVLAKVLLQWRHAALLQARCQQQKVTAMLEARKHLDRARLQTLFLHWKGLTRESLMLRAQQHRAVQHHQQHLLQKYLVKWKRHHHQCLGKVLLQRQGDQLRTHGLCSASFTCWRTRLLEQRWEKQKAVQALWHWSLSLQRKVFDAWLRFAKGQQQKKSQAENATGAYHPALLREGVTPAFRHTTDRKLLQGQLQVQHQLKAACSLHHSGDLCAMLWRQRAVSKNFNFCPLLPPLKKQVTFEVPAVSPETRGHSAEEEPCSRLPFQLASGGLALSDLAEAPFQQTAVSRCSAQSGALVQAPQLEESLPGTGSASASCPALLPAAFAPLPLWAHHVPWAEPSPQLCSPSPLLPQRKAGAEVRGGQPVSGLKRAPFQDSQQGSVKWQPNVQPHSLSPEDLLGKWSHQTAAAGQERERGCREAKVLERTLEAELHHIQLQMQYYFSRKQELKSCQQQAQILQKWLETSMQPGWMFKGPDGLQRVKEELDQVQARISTLSKAQGTERQHVQILLAHLHHIQAALDL